MSEGEKKSGFFRVGPKPGESADTTNYRFGGILRGPEVVAELRKLFENSHRLDRNNVDRFLQELNYPLSARQSTVLTTALPFLVEHRKALQKASKIQKKIRINWMKLWQLHLDAV